MPYFDYLEPGGIQDEGKLQKGKALLSSASVVEIFNNYRDTENPDSLRKFSAYANQVLNTSLLRVVDDASDDKVYMPTTVTVVDELLNKEEVLSDWVEDSLPDNAVSTIQNYKAIPDQNQEKLIGKQAVDSSEVELVKSSKDSFVTIASSQDDLHELEAKKLQKKIQKSGLKFVVDPEVDTESAFNSWLVAFSPMKGGYLNKLQKIKKKHHKKSLVEVSAEKSVMKTTQMVSEPLAKLLATQGHNLEAIEMYKRLILNIPEKSSYFAARIEELKNKA